MSIESARAVGDRAADEIGLQVAALIERATPRIIAAVASLDVGPNGAVLITVENVERVNTITNQIAAGLFDEQYLSAVADYLERMTEMGDLVEAGLRQFGADDPIMAAISRQARVAAATALLDTASYGELFRAIAAQMTNGIATGAQMQAVMDGVRQVIEQ